MSTLVPAAQDVFICFRCRYRLRVRQGPHPGYRRRTVYPPRLRHFTSSASLQQQPASDHHDAVKDDYLGRVPIRFAYEEPMVNQNHRPRLWPTVKDSLGLHVLGEPAEVLILRDKQRRFQLDSAMAKVRASGPDENPDPEPISSSEMLEKMDAERGKISLQEAFKNIQSVRAWWVAKKKSSISQDDYSELVSRLEMGFTRDQLHKYLDRLIGQNQTAGYFNLNFSVSTALYARSSWAFLGIMKPKTPALQETDVELVQRDCGGGRNKNAMAKMIIRQGWDIKSPLDSPLGQLEIRLQEIHFSLIFHHKRDILKLMSQSYDSKVEAWPAACKIRITADYDNCVDIVKLLIHTVKNIKTSKLDLDDDLVSRWDSMFPQTKLDAATWQQIDSYTNTIVRPSQEGLVVHYLGPDDTDLLETQRVVRQMLRPASTQVSKLAWSRCSKTADIRLVPVAVGSRLSIWRSKRQWSRWSCPQGEDQRRDKKERVWSDTDSTKSNPSKDIMIHDGKPQYRPTAYESTSSMHGNLGFNAVKSFFAKPDDTIYKTCSTNTPYWTHEIEYHDSVTFGQVLFPARNEILDTSRVSKVKMLDMRQKLWKKSGKHREFVPLAPSLLQMLDSVRPLKKSEEYLQVRLFPSSKNPSLPVPAKALPDLEIKIDIDDQEKTVSIKDVRLVTRVEKDYLQPQSVVDLRFIRKQCVYANVKVDPAIAAFVGNSNLNIWGTERLSTPLDLSLSIPALAVQPHQGFDPKAHESLLVDYALLGLEHRASLTFPYQDPDFWPTLSYTNVEAGRIGGRRDELSLHSHRFVSEQRQEQRREQQQNQLEPSTTSSDPAHPSSPSPSAPPVDTETEHLSEDAHAAIFFHKTDALVKSIEQSGREGGAWKMASPFPNIKRWRPSKSTTATKATPRPEASEEAEPAPAVVRRYVSDKSLRRLRHTKL